MLLFRHSWRVSLACVALGLALAGGVTASEPGEPAVDGVDAAIAREVRQTIAALGHERYSTRERASRRLDELVRNPALAPFLSGEISRALLSSETSVEARVRLEPLLTQLPPPSAGAPAPLTADEIGSMLSDLASNASAARAAAERRLDGMLVHVELIAPLLAELKRQLAHTATDRRDAPDAGDGLGQDPRGLAVGRSRTSAAAAGQRQTTGRLGRGPGPARAAEHHRLAAPRGRAARADRFGGPR